jgi:hypothetical protein
MQLMNCADKWQIVGEKMFPGNSGSEDIAQKDIEWGNISRKSI